LPISQPPVQLTSLSGTYATSTYLAAAKKSSKDLDSLAKDLLALEKKLKDDPKTADFLSECPGR
jgi:F-type H+-transporting ATPase subunit O